MKLLLQMCTPAACEAQSLRLHNRYLDTVTNVHELFGSLHFQFYMTFIYELSLRSGP